RYRGRAVTLTDKESDMDRRGFLECMAWAGSGVVWSMAGGVATSSVLGAPSRAAAAAGAFTFAQISDTHVGYKGAANPDALVTLQQSITRINALDPAPLSASTPLIVYAHVPLWTVYPQWGWVTEDGEQALALLRRFGSVTVLNGHIHQIVQKVEGSIAFHTARSTAFPQPAPGAAPSPGPLKVDHVARMLGIREVR